MPYSGIYPFYGHHLMAGMQLGMQSERALGTTHSTSGCDFIPVFTKRGDPDTLKTATEQLLFFERVDILSGLISYKTVPAITPIINGQQRPALFFDLGEYVPGTDMISPFAFYASQQIYQSEFALGYWAQKKFRNCGLVVLPVYEAGYQLHSSFWEGIQTAGGDALRLHTIPMEKSNAASLNLSQFFEAIEKNRPSFVHAIFTGNQGLDFLRQWARSVYYQKIPLVLIENMAYEDLLEDVREMDLNFYTASSWDRENERPANKRFVQKFEASSGQKANIFALLGYEAGIVLREVQPDLLKGDTIKVTKLLSSASINGPRGLRNFCPQTVQPESTIDILQIISSQKSIQKLVIYQAMGNQISIERMKTMHQECASGWQNPFLCV